MRKDIDIFPDEIKRAIYALDNEQSWKILERLIVNGRAGFLDIHGWLGMKNQEVTAYYLSELLKGAIIEQLITNKIEDRVNILSEFHRHNLFFEITPFGKNMINGIMQSLKPVVSVK